MNTGMLWFDNDPRTDLAEKVTAAAEYFQKKYGRKPNVCYLHPTLLPDAKTRTEGIHLLASKSVLKHHFWLGVEARNG
jgi:hypothetical protein